MLLKHETSWNPLGWNAVLVMKATVTLCGLLCSTLQSLFLWRTREEYFCSCVGKSRLCCCKSNKVFTAFLFLWVCDIKSQNKLAALLTDCSVATAQPGCRLWVTWDNFRIHFMWLTTFYSSRTPGICEEKMMTLGLSQPSISDHKITTLSVLLSSLLLYTATHIHCFLIWFP